ncbi:FitA-like ribbon-helix-helix domain-containing protein [Allosalinactinospora lopnorensis]|uniref:FitA-like ribbon-helix-helix domain-containing protein n=1 Tax=Allosalinactinospora lopnorensis TaxID=1352348 RepID=UPI000623CBF1|nr:hypothetical protein [Allosalinactinospora lopnorensis]
MGAIQVKDVPDEVREALTAAARRTGQSLQSYVLSILEREARFVRNSEIVDQCPLPGAELSMAEIVAAVRQARDGSDPGHAEGVA